jgi:small-conductance mechanosensitive channel
VNFSLYLVGYLLISVGILYALSQFAFIPEWGVIAAGFVLAGLGLIWALSRAKASDVADARTENLRGETPNPPPAPPPAY